MSSQFMQSMAVLEGARAALKVGAVSKGERVGFICDLRVEPDVIYAFFTAAGEIGATPFLCMVDRGRGYGPPDEFVETIKTANVLYFSWEMANSLVIKALRQERGIRCVGFPHCRTAALLADDAVRFPLDVLSVLYPKTWDVFRCGKDVDVQITDTKGTDFRVKLTKENIEEKFSQDPRYSGQIVANKPGFVSHLPVGHEHRLTLDEAYVNGHPSSRLPHNLNISFAYVEGESVLMGLNKESALSSGSACTSSTLEPSYVIAALGVDSELAHSSIRFGLHRFSTEEEVDFVGRRVVEVVHRLREMSPLYELAKEGVDLKTIQWKGE